MRWRHCTFKKLDNAQSNPWIERKAEIGKESQNRKQTVMKEERLRRGKEKEGEREGAREGECYRGTCS